MKVCQNPTDLSFFSSRTQIYSYLSTRRRFAAVFASVADPCRVLRVRVIHHFDLTRPDVTL